MSWFHASPAATLAGLSLYINDVHGIGLETGQGLLLSEMFHWDMNPRTRAFAGRVRAAMGGNEPNQEQAGGYSGVLNDLKAVARARSGAVGPVRKKDKGQPLESCS